MLVEAFVAATLQGWSLPAARPCGAEALAALTAPPDAADTPYRLTCRAEMRGAPILRRVLIEGAEASGAGVDCGGGAIGWPGRRTTTQAPTVAVWSRRIEGEALAWSRPTDVVLRNCTVHGAVRIWGVGAGGRSDDLLASSRTPEHTARLQGAAPSHIRLEGVTIVGTGSIPLYVGPGVTRVVMQGGRIAGVSDSVALYLDAESARNEVTGVTSAARTGREALAVDGSAGNIIRGNRFELGGRGGVFLYRNCGEGGIIRHQTPSGNIMENNVFFGADLLRPRTVVVGAREGGRRYCDADRGWPFGSSLDDGDHATGNIVRNNRVER